MNKKVKEILDGMKKANNENCNLWLENVSVKSLYKYITNLQYKYENQIHRYMNLKEQTINLQEENERLTFRVKELKYFNDILEQKEIERLKEIKNLQQEIGILRQNAQNLVKKNDESEEIIDKAIEFIKEKISSTQGVINDYMYHKEHNKRLIELLQEDIEMYKKELHILNGGDE